MRRRVTPQLLGTLVAVAFLVIGALGFVPTVTHHHGELHVWRGSGAELFGVFRVSVLHNALHIAFGLLGLAVCGSAVGARLYLIWGGIGYLAFWVYGAAVDERSGANVVPVDTADNWLHLALALTMLALAWIAASLDRERYDELPPEPFA